MAIPAALIERFKNEADDRVLPASDDQIRLLTELGLPESVLVFYRFAAPEVMVEVDDVRVRSVGEVFEENQDYVPGCYVSQHRFIVFATTFFGDTYCFDLETNPDNPPIVLISHEMIQEDTSAVEIRRLAKHVALDLTEFLELFLDGTLDKECLY